MAFTEKNIKKPIITVTMGDGQNPKNAVLLKIS